LRKCAAAHSAIADTKRFHRPINRMHETVARWDGSIATITPPLFQHAKQMGQAGIDNFH